MESQKSIDKKLIELLFNELIENKAQRIIAYSSINKLPYADFVLLSSSNSITHNKALAQKILLFFKSKNINPLTPTKKIENSSWIVMDYEDLIIHLFHGDTREKYNLEAIFNHLDIICQS